MSKILIVGHPNSGYRDVEGVLYKHGMKRANPSRREGFQADEISKILCQAHHAPDLDTINSENDIRQIDAQPVWNGVVLDLLLGNLDQEVWGWSDSNAIFLLEYWKNIDPGIIFMMVYDNPHRVLNELNADDIQKISSHTIKRLFDNWRAYNEHMLSFFLRNQNRCFMVHAQQARSETSKYLNALSSHIDLQLPIYTNGSALNRIQQNGVASVKHRSIIPRPTAPETDTYFMTSIMDAYPEYNQHYEELQSSANLPQLDPLFHDPCPLNAWLANMKQQSRTTNLVSQLSASHIQQIKDIAALRRTNKKLVEENEHLLSLKHEIQEKRGQNEHNNQSLKEQLQETTEENELLLSQLHQVHEELEHYYLENKRLKQDKDPTYYGAANRLKSELPYQLGAAIIERSRNIWPLAFLPFSVSRIARNHKKQLKKKTDALPPLTEYSDYHEAEKAQKHLSYRLGDTWLKHSRTPWGWVVMPFALTNAYREFRAYRASKDN